MSCAGWPSPPHLLGYPVRRSPRDLHAGQGLLPLPVPSRSDAREPLPSLSLARRTPEPEPLLPCDALLGPADRGPAAAAGAARAAVHPGFLAAAVHAGGDDAGPLLVGIQQSLTEFYKGAQIRHLSDTPPRAEAPEEQHFCSKYISDTGQGPLV